MDHQQLVRLGKLSSSTRTISTGAPQGCVLPPLLFSLYTKDPPPPHTHTHTLTIMNSTVTVVESFRFLGTTISQELTWNIHIDSVVKKAQQRLYFLRQLRKFNLSQELQKQFYSAITESVLCMSITVWFSSATKSDLWRMQSLVRTVERIIVTTLPTLQELYSSRVSKGAGKITLVLSHPAHSLWTVTVWLTLQSSEHQNDQTQEQFLPSRNPSHEHLTLNVEHTTLLYITYSSHILIFYFKFALIRPVH